MRTINEVLERKAYLEWFRKNLVYEFQKTELSRYWYTVASAYFRTLDNEIDMLRWMLGEIENTWEDDLSGWDCMLDIVQAEPQTRYPHLPKGADYHFFWGKRPRPVCRYFYGPDSPKDDQSFPFDQVQDPSTWNLDEFKHYHRCQRPEDGPFFFTGVGLWEDRQDPNWMAYELGEGPKPVLVNGAWTVGQEPAPPASPPVGE
ncbi:MAG: hypothetical protein EOO60_03620 [Hymenobacter sp.]|nr:MAG: hypothetical protein EOO60_03620 [Hymenobacter sp.]